MNGHGETIGYVICDNGDKYEVAHSTHGDRPIDYELAEKSVTRSTIQRFEFDERNWRFGRKPVRWTIVQK